MALRVRVLNFCYRQPTLAVAVVVLFCMLSLIRIPNDLIHPVNHLSAAYAIRRPRPHARIIRVGGSFHLPHADDVAPLRNDEPQPNPQPQTLPRARVNQLSRRDKTTLLNGSVKEDTSCFLLSSVKYGNLCIESIVGDQHFPLAQKLHADVRMSDRPKLILSLGGEITQANLQGCPDWNCRILDEAIEFKHADAVLVGDMHFARYYRRSFEQYVVYLNQEAYLPRSIRESNISFNMTMNFLRNSPVSSPYGYTVKLAPVSRGRDKLVDEAQLRKKSKAVAWFVSNCNAGSGRSEVVAQLQRYIDIDVYGLCGDMNCQKGGKCEERLNTDYHFYASFENTICKDYITEKLWHQGFDFDVVPLVLERRIVEQYLPPHSFIAVDDFSTFQEMAEYLKFLLRNETAYMEYFEWKRDYAVIYLDGVNHDQFERPWGVCQLCRLLWEEPRPHYEMKNFDEHAC